ncbi:hypothetical protein [Amycolatopsis sp. Hca4]|uniref:hypothetical protein n=1 Tax=Amycolatopsis sp. Hca4 TaxID=2742131 RepID=UPI001591E11D|nr:hypothetical protein [Amycolatopsis sp. Hca4]QKV74410.1 hypothetical protein HUT10_12000 [Amycolatopsis sp. Hca4]
MTSIPWTPIVGETPLTFSSVGAAAAQGAPLAEGAVSVAGTALGEGTLMAGASSTAVVVEGAIVADGAVTVGGALVAEGIVVTGGTVAAGTTAAGGTAAAAAGGGLAALALPALVVIGAVLVVAGITYLVVRAVSEEPAHAPGRDDGAPMTDPRPVVPAGAPGSGGREPVSDPGPRSPLGAPSAPVSHAVRLAGQSTRENEALVQRLRELRGRNPGLTRGWDELEQRLRDADVAVHRAAADELGRLEVEDFQLGPRTEPEPADVGDIDAQQNVYHDLAQHAWDDLEHRQDLTEAGVRTVREATQLIGEIIARAGRRDWWDRSGPRRDAEAVLDRETGLVVIINGPDSSEPGTVFRPDGGGKRYLERGGFVRRK